MVGDDGDDLPSGDTARSGALPLTRRLQFWGCAGLIVLAAVFYLSWGFSYGGWLDNGVYAVTIVLLLFGLAGIWLTTPNPPAPAPPRA